jgi:replication-associated recombination protein RarA
MHFAQLKTNGGYVNSEVTSAMQKSIRRGLEEEALFWATELDLAG